MIRSSLLLLATLVSLGGCERIAAFFAADARIVVDASVDDLAVERAGRDLAPDLLLADVGEDLAADARAPDSQVIDAVSDTSNDATNACITSAATASLVSGELRALAVDTLGQRVYAVGVDYTNSLASLSALYGCGATLAPDWVPATIKVATLTVSAATDVALCGTPSTLCITGVGQQISGSAVQLAFVAVPSTGLPTNGPPTSWDSALFGNDVRSEVRAVGLAAGLAMAWSDGSFLVGRTFSNLSMLSSATVITNLAAQASGPFVPRAFSTDTFAVPRLAYTNAAGTLTFQEVPTSCFSGSCIAAAPVNDAGFGNSDTAVAARTDVIAVRAEAGHLKVTKLSASGAVSSQYPTALAGFRPVRARFVGNAEVAVVGEKAGQPFATIINTGTLLPDRSMTFAVSGTLQDVARLGATLFYAATTAGSATLYRCPLGLNGQCRP
ncbi:MAG: hypothetical protein KC503_44470 [Myxococcales bacterium]|nr:hypothetical protein [Myxococcales bacterium]